MLYLNQVKRTLITKKIKEMKKIAKVSLGFILFVIVITIVNIVLFNNSSELLNKLLLLGPVALMAPMVYLSFTLPAGMVENEPPMWGKILLYGIAFPFAIFWMVVAADAIFHFLPSFREALRNGADISLAQNLRVQARQEMLTWTALIYASILTIAVFFRMSANKLRHSRA
jgi:hypothetical protein